jgi:hypothetical protein
VTIALGGHAGPAGAATSTLLEPGVSRILVISTPGVGWSSLNREDTPNLWALLEDSATGNLTARTVGRTDLASGYLTLGAGGRAAAPRSPLDGAGMEPAERFGEVTAQDAFRLNTGRDVGEGVLQLGLEPILSANAQEHLDAEVGALGDALARAGFSRAVIGNGDGSYPDQPDVMRRYAVSGLMTRDGVVPAGRAGAELLRDQPEAPFGVQYANDAVVAAFREVWRPESIVLVEASDLVRADSFSQLATPEQGAAALQQAVKRTDALVGQLLAEVDLARDAVVVVSPIRARGTVLSAVGVHAPGVPAGLVSSASTRRRGFVLLGDVAPTVLGLAGLVRDRDMTGSRFTVGRPQPLAARLDTLQDSTDAALFRDRVRAPVTLGFAAALGVVLAASAWVLARSRQPRRWRGVLETLALALLCYLPLVFLARVLPLHEGGALPYWAFLVVSSLVGAVVIRLATRRRGADAALVALALIVVVLVLDVVTGARLQLSSAFGYSATVGIRVAGYGNIAYALLGAAAVLGSAMLAHRLGGRRGAVAGCAVMAVALLADVAPFWGSDVGGVLSLVPAFGITAVMLLGLRIRLTWRSTAIAFGATLLVLAAVTAFDLTRPADARTHLGRFAQEVADRGVSRFTNTISRKIDANLDTWSTSEWRIALVVTVLFVGYLAIWQRARIGRLVARIPELRAGLVGIAVLALLGYAFNDSGVMVPAAALSVTCLTLVVLLMGEVAGVRADQRAPSADASTASVVAAAVSQE